MKNKTPLKFPSGEFTHTDLAVFNGKTNQQVWVEYQKAIKDGTIVSAGTRSANGRGKPSLLWKLATSKTNSTPAPAVPVVPTVTTPTAPVPTTVSTETAIIVPAETPKVETVQQPTVTAVQPEATVTKAEPVEEKPVMVEVLKVEPNGDVSATTPVPEKPMPVIQVEKIVENARTISETCPLCNHPLVAAPDETGIKVWCHQPSNICPSAENPFGHGSSEKEAYYKLVEKFTRKNRITSVGSERIKE